MKILSSSLKQTIKSSPFVLREINRYFGFYFIGFSLFVLFSLGLFLPNSAAGGHVSVKIASAILDFLAHIFIVFMIPYYAYKYNNKNIRPFWTFISETVWPVVVSQIKVALILLFFFLLLIIPALYKYIRYTFVIHTVFFDDLYKQGRLSVLKSADRTSRGYFWLIVLVLFCGFIFKYLPSLFKFMPFPSVINNSLSFVFKFYFSCLALLFQSQFYFELKKQREEKISC